MKLGQAKADPCAGALGRVRPRVPKGRQSGLKACGRGGQAPRLEREERRSAPGTQARPVPRGQGWPSFPRPRAGVAAAPTPRQRGGRVQAPVAPRDPPPSVPKRPAPTRQRTRGQLQPARGAPEAGLEKRRGHVARPRRRREAPGVLPRAGVARECDSPGPDARPQPELPAAGTAPSPVRSGGGQEPAAAPHHQHLPAQSQARGTCHLPARRAAPHVRRRAPLPAGAAQ